MHAIHTYIHVGVETLLLSFFFFVAGWGKWRGPKRVEREFCRTCSISVLLAERVFFFGGGS